MPYTRLLRTTLVPVLAVMLLAFAPSAARATTSADQRAAATALAAQVVQLDARLGSTVAQYAAAAQRMQTLQQAIAAERKQLRVAQYQLDLARQTLAERAAAAYKDRDVSLLDVVLGSGSFEDLMSNLDFARRLDAHDAQVVQSVQQQAASVRRDLADLSAKQASLRSTLDQIGKQRAAIAASLTQRRSLLAGAKARLTSLAKPSPTPSSIAPAASSDALAPQGSWWPAIQAAAKAKGISARGLYRLMMVESGGVATITNGVNYGLFQYSPGTWHGGWNPWRGRPITDGAAQIKATALAIHLGYGPSWWPSTYPYAFSGD
jgi:peptidoglycan hydrolase CwlO-like protein